jgi:hypothetical protein
MNGVEKNQVTFSPDGQAGTGKGVSVSEFRGEAEVAAENPDLL